MKPRRHKKILELVNEYDIYTQEELINRLTDAGFSVTQATISRDIKDLRISKTMGSEGKYRYTSDSRNTLDNQNGFESLFISSALSVDSSENIVVVKTMSGMAQAVCASLDNLEMESIVGTIAGDDTIFIVLRTRDIVNDFSQNLKKLLQN